MTMARDIARAEGAARSDTIARMFAAGDTSGTIAQALGITRSAVMGTIHRLRAAGDPRVPAARAQGAPGRKRLPPLADRLAELVAQGASLTTAAWKLDLPRHRVDALWADICHALGPQAV